MIVQGPDGKRIQFPDGTAPEVIKAAMAKQYGAPKTTQRQVGPAGGYFEGPYKYQENFGGDPLRHVPVTPYNIPLGPALDAFPAMGGAVGSVVGGPIGAAVGGGSMETLRRSLRGMPFDKGIGREALWQGGLALGGAALGAGAAMAAKGAAPVARMAEKAIASPILRRLGRMGSYGLPIAGGVRGGIPGALAGMALPVAGRAALRVAMSPKTEAFLGSQAFRTFARHSPQAAAQVVRQLLAEEPDVTQVR